ncbi:hypothetical protein EXT70_26745, partial [Dickeya dadantii]|nr:hypothetical protein [Dickeya dadantii]
MKAKVNPRGHPFTVDHSLSFRYSFHALTASALSGMMPGDSMCQAMAGNERHMLTSVKTGTYTMPVLHNRVSNKELKARMLAETEPRTTVSFYKYFTI